MRFAKPVRKSAKKGLNQDTDVYTMPVTTTVSVETRRKFDDWNTQKPHDKITWADCIRRGFFSIYKEKQGLVLDDLTMGKADYIPIQVKERIHKLSGKIQEMATKITEMGWEMDILQGKVPKKEDKLK